MRRALGAIAFVVLGCGGDDRRAAPPIEPAPWSDAWLAREGRRYLDEPATRRAALEASLTNPHNRYSQQRLDAYALPGRGWELLPIWNPRARVVDANLARAIERGEPLAVDAAQPPLWDGRTPDTTAAWIALGRRVFFEYPLRAEVFMEYGLTRPALADAVGVERTADGAVPGLVVFADVDGAARVGITCAICHTAVRDGALVVGAARRRFDYGRLRVAYFAETGVPVDAELARRMATWGPGRADVTEDNDQDPVAIPDLWGLRTQRVLTQAGTIQHASPLALAIRQETQLLHTNHQRVRPPRELAWALAMFLYALAPPPPPPSRADPTQLAEGRALFATHCARCHASAAYGGGAMAASTIGTDRALADGRARGTGRYRIAPLLDVGRGAPYLHDGSVASLDELLAPDRLVPGHRAGTELPAAGRAALIAFLVTL